MLFSSHFYIPYPEEKSISLPHVLLPIFQNCYIHFKAVALPKPEFVKRPASI